MSVWWRRSIPTTKRSPNSARRKSIVPLRPHAGGTPKETPRPGENAARLAPDGFGGVGVPAVFPQQCANRHENRKNGQLDEGRDLQHRELGPIAPNQESSLERVRRFPTVAPGGVEELRQEVLDVVRGLDVPEALEVVVTGVPELVPLAGLEDGALPHPGKLRRLSRPLIAHPSALDGQRLLLQ